MAVLQMLLYVQRNIDNVELAHGMDQVFAFVCLSDQFHWQVKSVK